MNSSVFRPWLAVMICTMVVAGAIGPGWAYPRPSVIPVSWHLDLTHQLPQTIAVRGVDGMNHWYWFMPYKVVNNSDKEQFFVPQFTIATDRGDIIEANRGIGANVFSAIKARSANRLLLDPQQVSGRLLLSEDNAKESVAIWPVFKHDVDELRIFCAGFNGEQQIIKLPQTGKEVTLRKTKMVTFHKPGSPARQVTPQRRTIKMVGQAWVMR